MLTRGAPLDQPSEPLVATWLTPTGVSSCTQAARVSTVLVWAGVWVRSQQSGRPFLCVLFCFFPPRLELLPSWGFAGLLHSPTEDVGALFHVCKQVGPMRLSSDCSFYIRTYSSSTSGLRFLQSALCKNSGVGYLNAFWARPGAETGLGG